MATANTAHEANKKKKVKLGIDGKHLNGDEEIFVLGDVGDKEFLGVTETNTSECLQRTLRTSFTDEGIVLEVVNMDMDRRIKGAVRSVDKNVPIVVDKFHLIKFTNRTIDLCRIAVEKSIQERLEIKRLLVMKTEVLKKIKNKPKWQYKVKRLRYAIDNFPEIKILWDLKNKLHGFYKCKSLTTATESWIKILQFLDQHISIHPELKELKKTFLNWEVEILNYFIFWTTNAFIEGLNNRIETLKRKKFGFRSKEKFIKCLCYLLFPISDFFHDLIFTHFF